MELITCPECGRMILNGGAKCLVCGTSQEKIQYTQNQAEQENRIVSRPSMRPPSERKMKCVSCLQETVSNNAKYCSQCGYPFFSLVYDKVKVERTVKQYRKLVNRSGKIIPEIEQIRLKEGQVKVLKDFIQEQDHIYKVKKVEISENNSRQNAGNKRRIKTMVVFIAAILCATTIIGILAMSEKPEEETSPPVLETPVKQEAVKEKHAIGDLVTFGKYEQDNNTANGAEPIEWTILDVKEDNIYLLLSNYGLDAKPYYEDWVDSTWEVSSIRSWLNGVFFHSSFLSSEQEKVQNTLVTADQNPEYDTDPGENTVDKVFLLSIQEAEKYFDSGEERKAEPTEYAKQKGAYENENTDGCWWWLRSPGNLSNYAACVTSLGWIGRGGESLNSNDGCIRPAMWVRL